MSQGTGPENDGNERSTAPGSGGSATGSTVAAGAPGFVERRLINRDFSRLWYGMAVSTLGDAVFDTTLVLWIATVLARGRSWAPAAVSGVVVAVGVATIVVGPVAGVFVDRWDRRRTMLRSELFRGVLVAVLAAVSFLPVSALPAGVWLAMVYAVVVLVNSAGQFFQPSRFAIITQIVHGEADRAKAMGITQATFSAAQMIGPPLAAPLLFAAGFQWALLLNAASYAFSFFAIRSIRIDGRAHPAAPPAPEPEASGAVALEEVEHSVWREFREGVRFFAHSRYLVALLTVAVIITMGAGALNALDIFFVTDNLHVSPHVYGFLAMTEGAGAIVGALCAGWVVQRIGARQATWLPLLIGGLMVLVYARQTMLLSALACIVAIAVPVAVLNVAIGPLMMDAAPMEMLGRVMAVFNPIQMVMSIVSTAVASWLASTVMLNFHAKIAGVHMGRIDTIFTVSGLLVVLGGLYGAFALPRGSAKPGPT